MRSLRLRLRPETLAICRLPPGTDLERLPRSAAFWSATRTPEELSLVLPEAQVSDDWQAERGWRSLSVEGPLAFELSGVLASLVVPLADAGVSIFAISTYDTDHLLVRETSLDKAIEVLQNQGHLVRTEVVR